MNREPPAFALRIKKRGGSLEDWVAIKTEYISTPISQRKLAQKHKVSRSLLQKKAAAEGWTAAKKAQLAKIEKKTAQKVADKISSAQADRLAKILNSGDKLAATIDRAIGQIERNGEVDTYKLRQIVQSLKDLKEIISTTQSTDNGAAQETARKALIDAIRNGDNADK